MTKESLIKQLETTCYGLDPIDPLRLLVDDVIAALREHAMQEVQRLGQEIEQEPVVGITAIRTWFKDGRVVTQTLCNSWVDTTPPQRTWVGLTDEDKKQMAKEANYHWEMTTSEYAERIGELTEAKLKELNI
jgi:hypothetical protein